VKTRGLNNKKENDMECIGKVVRMSDGHVFVAGNDGDELNVFPHVGQSLFTGDYDALLKELHELRKDKARKQYLIDSVQFVIPFDENKHALCEADFFEIILDSQSETADKDFFDFHESADAAIDAAIAKSENTAMLD
jgi:hypothetical protein